MKGAVDDLDMVIEALEKNGFKDRFYIHCDGALFGLMMPFAKRVCSFNHCFYYIYLTVLLAEKLSSFCLVYPSNLHAFL